MVIRCCEFDHLGDCREGWNNYWILINLLLVTGLDVSSQEKRIILHLDSSFQLYRKARDDPQSLYLVYKFYFDFLILSELQSPAATNLP